MKRSHAEDADTINIDLSTLLGDALWQDGAQIVAVNALDEYVEINLGTFALTDLVEAQIDLSNAGGVADWALAITAASAANLPGDFNLDGSVDGDDLAGWEAAYGTSGGEPFDGDADGADVLVWQRHFTGPAASSADPIVVPEPSARMMMSTFALLLLAYLAMPPAKITYCRTPQSMSRFSTRPGGPSNGQPVNYPPNPASLG